jgi:soluble lytic murein transglycosylase-like protein
MKLILLAAVLAASAPAVQADPTQAIVQRDQAQLLADVKDWGGYLAKLTPEMQSKYGPELAQIDSAAETAATVETLRPAQLRLEAWKQGLTYELFPFLQGRGLVGRGSAAVLAQAQVEAFQAVAKLQQSAVSAEQKKFFQDFKGRISQVTDAPSLDRLFDNAGFSRPAPVAQTVFYRGGGAAAGAAAPARGLVIHDVPSPFSVDAADRARFAKVSDYLKSRGASQKVIDMTISEAARQNVDPLLVLALVQNESGFQAGATSAAGARGLMQIMPETGRGLGVSNSNSLYDPSVNLRAGVSFLKSLGGRFSDLKNVIASYNAGPGAVQKYGGVPPYRETVAYVKNVLGTYLHLRGLFNS